MSEAYILLLDSSTEACTVAIASESQGVVSYLEEQDRKLQSERLAVMASEVIAQLPDGTQLSAICVAEGPGSYTGLRISAGYAKGLALSLNIPIMACTTTDLMVQTYLSQYSQLDDSTLLMPMIDARRMEVYSALYSSRGEVQTEIAALILTEPSFQDELVQLVGHHQLIYFGSGATKAQDIITRLLPSARFVPHIEPHARDMSALAFKKYSAGEVLDTAYWEPYYLKEYHAKKSLNKVLYR